MKQQIVPNRKLLMVETFQLFQIFRLLPFQSKIVAQTMFLAGDVLHMTNLQPGSSFAIPSEPFLHQDCFPAICRNKREGEYMIPHYIVIQYSSLTFPIELRSLQRYFSSSY